MLFIEKVIFNSQPLSPFFTDNVQQNTNETENEIKIGELRLESADVSVCSDEEEEAFKTIISSRGRFASFMQIRNCKLKI